MLMLQHPITGQDQQSTGHPEAFRKEESRTSTTAADGAG